MKLVFVGGPGSGKGTRAKLISERFGIPHISTGDIFRKNIKENTKHSDELKKILDSGELVPDSLTVEMLKERLTESDCEKGFILDGFPRNINQAEKFGDVDHAIFCDCAEEVLLKRLGGRMTCKDCGEIYNKKGLLPKEEGKCDKCTGELVVREDQKEDVIKQRMKVYKEQTEPLLEYYKDKIARFNTSIEMDESVAEIANFLENRF